MCDTAENCKVNGTFVTTKTQEVADFWCKVGKVIYLLDYVQYN